VLIIHYQLQLQRLSQGGRRKCQNSRQSSQPWRSISSSYWSQTMVFPGRPNLNMRIKALAKILCP